MRKKYLLLSLFLIFVAASLTVSAQKGKLPSNIGDAFVLEFSAPFERILIQTSEKNMPNGDFAEIFITAQTKLKNHKGKTISADAVRAGMEVEIELDKTETSRLTAKEIKLRTNPEKREEGVDGYLDRVEDTRAMVDGRIVELAPNAVLVGIKESKGETYRSFKEIKLGSLVDLKGLRQKNNRVILITRGEVRPNLFTQVEAKLIESVKQGLVLPSNAKGASVVIGNNTYKVCPDLEVNAYVTKVGYRIVPKFLKFLPENDPNKVLFRFYVLEDDVPNAVAFSDGSVFINTGLLKRLENEAQLAIILGHEIAHVTNEHSRRRFEAQQTQSFLSTIIAVGASVAGEQIALAIGKLSYQLMSNKFSRDMEDQADRVGLYYAYDAGYDVRESTAMWRKIMGGYRESAVGTILYADHPTMLARLKEMRHEVVLNYANADFSEADIRREEFQKGVGYYFGWLERPKPTVTSQTTTKQTNKPNKKTQKTPVKPQGDGFAAFFAKFKKAVSGNNRAAVKDMMSLSFEWALDGYISRDEAFNLLDNNLWAGLKSAVLRRPVKCKSPYCNNRAGYRVWSTAKYKVEIMFEKDSAGNWHWTALLGD